MMLDFNFVNYSEEHLISIYMNVPFPELLETYDYTVRARDFLAQGSDDVVTSPVYECLDSYVQLFRTVISERVTRSLSLSKYRFPS